MSNHLVSICIPNYNNAAYLDACIQSALDQTYPDTEVILVDDCSTDNSIQVAKQYEGKIRILQNSANVGQPQNTNKAVEHSNGEYVVILHSDDSLLPHFAETLVPILESHPNVGMAVGERMETDETGIPRDIAPLYNTNCIIPGERQAKVFLLTSFLPCQVLLRREIFETIGGVDERYIINLDGLLWFKCALICDVGYIQNPVSVYRRHGENTTTQYIHSIDLIVEHYRTLSEMFKLARGRPYLEQFFDTATKRVGELALRYSHSIFRSGDFDLVKRYLSLALVYDPDLAGNHTYRTLKYCAESDAGDRSLLYQKLIGTMTPEVRQFSFDPPDGFVPLKMEIDRANDLVPGDVISELLNLRECKTHSDLTRILDALKGKRVVIYGAGKIGERVYRFFLHYGIPVSFFWDAKAELIRDVGNLPVLQPDFQHIPPEERESYVVIVTVFSENVCHMIRDRLLEAGFCNTITDRKFVNSLIYFKCKAEIHEKKFHFELTTCFFCPNAKGNVASHCDIYDDNVKRNLGMDKLSFGHDNALVIPSMGVLISTKCTLKCEGCNHLREHYKPSDNFDIEALQVLDDVSRILDAVDFIHSLVIVGGESFLHRDFKDVIDGFLRLPKTGIIHIITNGTVVPKDESVFETLANPRLVVEISGYGEKIPKRLREKVKVFTAKMDEFHINYLSKEQMQWFDFGGFEDRGYSKEELSRVYSSCICVSNDLFDGKLYKCSRSAFGTYLGKITDYGSDYVDVRRTPKKDMSRKLAEFFGKKYIETCRFCNGTSTSTMEAGKQLKDKESV